MTMTLIAMNVMVKTICPLVLGCVGGGALACSADVFNAIVHQVFLILGSKPGIPEYGAVKPINDTNNAPTQRHSSAKQAPIQPRTDRLRRPL